MFDKNLVHALIGGKDPDGGPAELSLDLGPVKLGFVRRGFAKLSLNNFGLNNFG
jgi:hypothetical protein